MWWTLHIMCHVTPLCLTAMLPKAFILKCIYYFPLNIRKYKNTDVVFYV